MLGRLNLKMFATIHPTFLKQTNSFLVYLNFQAMKIIVSMLSFEENMISLKKMETVHFLTNRKSPKSHWPLGLIIFLYPVHSHISTLIFHNMKVI
jgi:hypothetical protein